MKPLSTLSALFLCGFATFCAGQDLPKHTPRAVKTTQKPVSQAEARAVFLRTENILRKALSLPSSKPAVTIADAGTPVTRAQVVAEFSRLYTVLRPKMKLTPRATAFDAKVVRLSDAKQKANLMALIRAGAVAKLGPLSTGPADTLTVPQFGDAVGFFISRMAYMTHLPSADWTGILKS